MEVLLIIGWTLFLGASLIYIGLTIYELWTEKQIDKKDWFYELSKSIF